MIPGKKITVGTALANAEQVKNYFESFSDKPSGVAMVLTAKPKSEWVSSQLVGLVFNASGTVVGMYRDRGGAVGVVGVNLMTSAYDVISQANTEYYLVEVTP